MKNRTAIFTDFNSRMAIVVIKHITHVDLDNSRNLVRINFAGGNSLLIKDSMEDVKRVLNNILN